MTNEPVRAGRITTGQGSAGQITTGKSVWRRLPPSLREMADLVGEDITCAVALEYGGGFWRVPKAPDHARLLRLAEQAGREQAAGLCRTYGGHRIEVPLARRALVLWLYRRGWSALAITVRLCMSHAVVRRYIREGP